MISPTPNLSKGGESWAPTAQPRRNALFALQGEDPGSPVRSKTVVFNPEELNVDAKKQKPGSPSLATFFQPLEAH